MANIEDPALLGRNHLAMMIQSTKLCTFALCTFVLCTYALCTCALSILPNRPSCPARPEPVEGSIENPTLAHFRHFSSLFTNLPSTYVESPLQIAHFMQNKANFGKAQMNLNKVITKYYENIANCKLCENKANSKPNKANLLNDQMNVNKVLTKDYDNKSNWALFENKANTKPIQTQSNPIKPNSKPIKANIMPKQTQYKPKQSQPVVSLPALSLLVLSIVEGSKGSNLFHRRQKAKSRLINRLSPGIRLAKPLLISNIGQDYD